MRRRDFISLVGSSAVASPFAARAQQPAMPTIGHLCGESPERWTDRLRGLARGLNEVGYFEGQNVAIEHRWAEGEYDRLPALAADLTGRRVTMIVVDGAPAAVAAKAASTTIPIVFFTGGDPVRIGLVTSLNRPRGNVTGVSVMNVELATKRLEILHELLPGAVYFAMLVNPNSVLTDPLITELRAARAVGYQLEFLTAATNQTARFLYAARRRGGRMAI
jgi:putative tryptophan/tyrosine transport system substrate-binding protein